MDNSNLNSIVTDENNEDWVRRYVANQLNEQELETFELYMLEHPEVLNEIAIEQALVDGCHDAFKATRQNPGPVEENTRTSFLQRIHELLAKPAVLVSTYACAIVLGLGLYQSPQPDSVAISQGQSLERVWVEALRSHQMPSITIAPGSNEHIVLDMEVLGPQTYSIKMSNAKGQLVLHRAQAQADEGGLSLYLNRSQMAAGKYIIQVLDQRGQAVINRELIIP